MFRYRKLYTDLVTESGSVCVGYVSWLRILGFELVSGGYEWYPAGGERIVRRAQGPITASFADPRSIDICFAASQGPFRLSLRSPSAMANNDTQHLTPHLSWRIVTARADARAFGLPGGEHAGSGYADYVEMTRPPRSLGLKMVEWGRGHGAADSFVFTRATFVDGKVFRFALSSGKCSPRLELVRSQEAELGLRLAEAEITLRNERVLHSGGALDAERFPDRTERAFSRLCSGPIHETRWLGRARFPGGHTGLALHEQVLVGHS
jgi:hypothetical protein